MELKELSIEKIRPNPLQPREHFDREKIQELANSISKVNLIQPIIVRPKGNYFEIISGERRWKASQIAGLKKIPAIIKSLGDDQILVESLIENVHREDLSVGEKIKALEKIRKLQGLEPNGRGLYTTLSKITGISLNSIAMWYDETNVRKKTNADVSSTVIQETRGLPEKDRIKLLKVADRKEIGGRRIRDYVSTIKISPEPIKQKLLRGQIEPERAMRLIEPITTQFEPRIYNVWNFMECDSRFGRDGYPGRIPGQIVQNVLHYFTKEGDLVVDPMGGSGTTVDVCKSMKRRFLCYDISLLRDRNDVKFHDMRFGFPQETKNCDFIFLDPPYWRLKKGHYAKESVSNLSVDGWLDFMRKLAKNCYTTVKRGGHVALLIEAFLDERVTGQFLDFPFECLQFFKNAGFTEIQRISVPISSQVKSVQDVEYAKRKKIMLDLNRDLIIFKKL